MQFLFIGPYDMAGSAISTRIYREGGRIAWLTEEPARDLWGEKIHGKVFRHEITSRICSQILSGDGADCIVIMTAPWREWVDGGPTARGALLEMLDRVLQATKRVHVASICLLSSDILSQSKLLDPCLEELRAAERIADSFCRRNHLGLLTLRTGLLFGREDPHSTLAGALIDDMAADHPVRCPITADSQLDLVCSTDLADAFLRLFNLKLTGVHTVLTGTAITARALCDTVAEVTGYDGEVLFGPSRAVYNESRAAALRSLCGWMPFYLFEKHGVPFLRESMAHEPREDREARPKIKLTEFASRHPLIWETLQNLLLFVIATLVSSMTEDWSDLRYVDVRLLYVVIVSICFGMRQSLLATALAAVSYAASLFTSGVDLTYLLYSVSGWIPFIVYGVAGAFGGYWSDKQHDEYDNLEHETKDLQDRYDLLKNLYRESIEVKDRLQKQIVVSKNSFTRMYTIMSELDSNDPRALLARTVRVIEQTMESNGAAIYLLAGSEKRWARLAVCSAAWSGALSPSLDLAGMPALYDKVSNGSLFINTDLMEAYPSYAMPVMGDKGPEALVAVYGVSMELYTVDYENRFRTLVLMIQGSLMRAFSYEQEHWDRFYLPNTRIYNAEAFAREMETLRVIDRTYGCPFSCALLRNAQGQSSPLSIYERAKPLMRDTDLMGIGADGRVHAVFLNVDEVGRSHLQARLASQGLNVQWED